LANEARGTRQYVTVLLAYTLRGAGLCDAVPCLALLCGVAGVEMALWLFYNKGTALWWQPLAICAICVSLFIVTERRGCPPGGLQLVSVLVLLGWFFLFRLDSGVGRKAVLGFCGGSRSVSSWSTASLVTSPLWPASCSGCFDPASFGSGIRHKDKRGKSLAHRFRHIHLSVQLNSPVFCS